MRQIIRKIKKNSFAIKFEMHVGKKSVGRIYLYIIQNDLHQRPYGFLEDLFVDENMRGKRIGSALLYAAIKEAKKQKLYKLIGTSRKSRKQLHSFYQTSGFKIYGVEFRMDL